MADNISFANGRHEVFTRKASWHNFGVIVDHALTSEQAIVQAGVDWSVTKEPLFDKSGVELPGAFGIFREDNRAFLGSVGTGYTAIQNRFQFEFVDELLEADGKAFYESAGALGKGERVWVMANLNADIEVVPGDVSKQYIAFVNSHDGSSSAKAFLTSVRIVCQNTLNMALSSANQVLSVRHTVNAEARLTEARELFQGARQTSETLQEKLRVLASRELRGAEYQAIVQRLFYAGKTQEQIDKDKRTENVLTKILERYDANDGNVFPEIRGTAYNLFNAITEHTDHFRAVRRTAARIGQSDEEIRADLSLFGEGATLKNRALEVILAATENSPTVKRPVYSVPSTFNDKSVLDAILSQN